MLLENKVNRRVLKFCSNFNILYDIITSKLKISEKHYVKEKFETK